jgi:hypothetical protein
VAFLTALLWRETTRVSIALALAAAFVASIDLAISLSTGVFIPVRAVLWLWFVMCVPAIVLFFNKRNALLVPIGAAVLVLNLASGIQRWWRVYSVAVATVRAEEQLAYDIREALALAGSSSVVSFGNPKADPRFRRLYDETALHWSLLKRFGLRVETCEPEFCHRIEQAVPHATHTTISSLEGRVVVVFPPQP